MANALKSSAISAARTLKKTAKSSPFISRLAYNFWNASHFSDLFEHEQLLADDGRCDTYAKAIKTMIKPGSVVVDVGTGTGLLAMLAARIEGTKVYAIDHSNLIHLSEKVARANGFENIHFIKTNSQTFTPDEKVDVILHEQIGDDLFEENMVHNLLDLKKRILKPDGIILPGRFKLYAEPVQIHPDFHTPFINEINTQGLDFSLLREEAAKENLIHRDYNMRYMSPSGFQASLTAPIPALDVDLNKITDTSDVPSEIELVREFSQDGLMGGIGIWFDIVFNDEISLSTSPFERHTHWAHRVYRTPSMKARNGETVSYKITMPDLIEALTWSIDLKA